MSYHRCRRFSRRGATIILVAVLAPVLIGFMALAVDVGLIYAMDAETQAAADAAALAGVSALVNNDSATAIQRSRDYLSPNLVSRTGSPNTSVIDVGHWDEAGRTFATGAARPNAVRVTVTRHDAPLFFAAIFGALHYDMTRSATAMIGPPATCRIWGLQGATIAGATTTDSYDSTRGPYNPASPGSEGNVCSCQDIRLNGSPTIINGTAYYGSGYTYTTTGQAQATNGADILPACINPSIDMTYVSTHNNNAAIGRASGAALTLRAHKSLTLPAGDYYFSSLTLNSQSVLACNGTVNIYVSGNISNNSGTISNSSTNPWNLNLYCNGTSVSWNGSTNFYGSLIAPNADITYRGGSDLFGACVGKTINFSGGSSIHVDVSLPATIMNGSPAALVK